MQIHLGNFLGLSVKKSYNSSIMYLLNSPEESFAAQVQTGFLSYDLEAWERGVDPKVDLSRVGNRAVLNPQLAQLYMTPEVTLAKDLLLENAILKGITATIMLRRLFFRLRPPVDFDNLGPLQSVSLAGAEPHRFGMSVVYDCPISGEAYGGYEGPCRAGNILFKRVVSLDTSGAYDTTLVQLPSFGVTYRSPQPPDRALQSIIRLSQADLLNPFAAATALAEHAPWPNIDPDRAASRQSQVPLGNVTSKEYADGLAATIDISNRLIYDGIIRAY